MLGCALVQASPCLMPRPGAGLESMAPLRQVLPAAPVSFSAAHERMHSQRVAGMARPPPAMEGNAVAWRAALPNL